MAFVDQDQVLAGLQLVVPNVRFDSSVATAGGSDGDTAGIFTAAPSFFYVNRVSDRWSLGLSVAGIMGGGVDYGDDFTGRYSTSRAQLSAVGLSPSIAYKIDDRF
jgi:long-chain fatty acid transport protein